MPPKKRRGKGKHAENEKKALETEDTALCFLTPGPKYQLKTLVGYKDHCISRYRNPAYTFGGRHIVLEVAETPGPKYKIKEHRPEGFTFGLAAKRHYVTVGSGPYKLPDIPRGPFFSIKWRTKLRKPSETPGPYYVKPIADAPAFSMGLRTVAKIPVINTGLYSYNMNAVKPKAPMYTIASRKPLQLISESPGPIYAIQPFKSTPAFSFGVKHYKCAPPLITECDKQS